MSQEKWNRVQAVFEAARQYEPEARAAYLAQTCAGDAELRGEVDSLLAAHRVRPSVRPNGGDLPHSAHLAPGTVIGYYEIRDLLGAGGMGEVYRAVDTRLGREVAFKILSNALLIRPDLLQRFDQEVRAVAALNHPNICHLYDLGEWQGRPFFTMELLEGQTLRQRINGRPLPISELLDFGIQISDALETAHAKGILHRDIKPANIFITARGVLKVVDFGLAKRSHPLADASTESFSGPHTTPGQAIGTLVYMSPEQARAEPLDARTDLFSFGAVLYEMATGVSAFGGASNAVIFDGILNRAPVPPSQLNPETPELLQELIENALEKDREVRCQSAAEMKAALRRCKRWYQAGQFTTADHSSPMAREQSFPGGHAGPPSVQSAGKEASGTKSVAVLPFQLLHGEHADDAYLGVGLADALITKLSGMRRLVVRPTSSVVKYAGHGRDLLAAGRELAVSYVIGGVIRRFGSHVRVSVQLLQVRDGAPLWAAQFDEKFTHILNLEDSISGLAAQALIPRLNVDEREQLNRRDTQNPEAFEAYLKGRYYWNTYTVTGMSKALVSFMDAIAKDENYARAHAGVADYYNWVGAWGVLPPKESFAAAKAAAGKALSLDSTCAETQTSYGYSVWNHDWDWEGAEAAYRRAVQINPNYAPAVRYLALLLSAQERHTEAIERIESAVALDPFAPVMASSAGLILYNAGQYDRSLQMSRKTLELNPEDPVAWMAMAWAYNLLEQHEDAIDAARKSVAFSVRAVPSVATLAAMLAHHGAGDEARQLLAELKIRAEKSPVPAYHLALIHLALGDRESALACLERSVEQHEWWTRYLRAEPRFRCLRQEPRFQALLARLGLPAEGAFGHTSEHADPARTSRPIAFRWARLVWQRWSGLTADRAKKRG